MAINNLFKYDQEPDLETILEHMSRYLHALDNGIRAAVEDQEKEALAKDEEDFIDLLSLRVGIFTDNIFDLFDLLVERYALSRIKQRRYHYVTRIQADMRESSQMYLPAKKASQCINGMQETFPRYYNNSPLYLTNVLHGSTVLCFRYSLDQILKSHTPAEMPENNIQQAVEAIQEAFKQEDNIPDNDNGNMRDNLLEKIGDIIKKKKKDTKLVLKGIQKMTPTRGTNYKVQVYTGGKVISMNETVRKGIGFMLKSKDFVNINQEEKTMQGYLREIDDFHKSFILYSAADDNTSVEEIAKVHYREDSFEKFLKENFKKRVQVQFSKEKGKYYIEGGKELQK